MSQNPRTLSPAERRTWLRLARTEGIGPVRFNQLIAKYKSPGRALDALRHLVAKSPQTPAFTPPPWDAIDRELDQLNSMGARLIASIEPDFPTRLAHITPPPPVIAVLGTTPLNPPMSLAIVGARNASALGRRFTTDMARELGRAGVTIVSGLARGIDGAAHHASLDTGSIAVVAGGLDVIYPPEHDTLHAQLAQDGAIIAERALGTQPTARDFPRRNRLISGLADAVLVIEAGRKSGSLITARYAGEQGRDVFAIPGHPADPRSAGANHLIKNGAALIETAQDVLDALTWTHPGRANPSHSRPHDTPTQPPALDMSEPPALPFEQGAPKSHLANADVPPDHAQNHEKADDDTEHEDVEPPPKDLPTLVLSLLSATPTHRDDIIRASGHSPSAIAATLLELELAGQVIQQDGDYVSLSA